MVIHETLKRGAYKPALVMKYPKTVAVLLTFLASGLLHDLCWAIMFYKSVHNYDAHSGMCTGCFDPIRFKESVFFMWCGLTMVLEEPISKLRSIQWIAKNLPRWVVSTLVVMTALPFAHWFAGDWIVGGFFNHFSIGTFKIVYKSAVL